MDLPDYDRTQPQQFGGVLPTPRTLADSKAVILPVPFARTTSSGQGTKHGPRELLLASAQVELWDEELGVDVHPHGMVTLPEMDLSAAWRLSARPQCQWVSGSATGRFVTVTYHRRPRGERGWVVDLRPRGRASGACSTFHPTSESFIK